MRGVKEENPLSSSRQDLALAQQQDEEVAKLRRNALSDYEIESVPVGYYLHNDVLMRKYRPPDVPSSEEWSVIHQIVVPTAYRKEILSMAHDLPYGGHLGVKKTKDRILRQFCWPEMDRDVKAYCRSCHTCQVVGKAQVDPPSAPWQSIPAFGELFPRVIIDCVGLLPKTKSGNQYVLDRKVDVSVEESDPDRGGKVYDTTLTPSPKLLNSETLARLTDKLQHLTTQQRLELDHTLWAHEDVFPDAPTIAKAAVHDVDVGDTKLIKTHACRRSPDKRILTDKEIAHMLWVINCSNGSQSLVFLNKMKHKNRRLLQWSLLLQEYNLDVRHVRGKDNIIADALSRC